MPNWGTSTCRCFCNSSQNRDDSAVFRDRLPSGQNGRWDPPDSSSHCGARAASACTCQSPVKLRCNCFIKSKNFYVKCKRSDSHLTIWTKGPWNVKLPVGSTRIKASGGICDGINFIKISSWVIFDFTWATAMFRCPESTESAADWKACNVQTNVTINMLTWWTRVNCNVKVRVLNLSIQRVGRVHTLTFQRRIRPLDGDIFEIHSSDASILKDLYLMANNTQSGNQYANLGE